MIIDIWLLDLVMAPINPHLKQSFVTNDDHFYWVDTERFYDIVTLDDNDEYNNHERLAEYAFDNYSNYEILDKNDFDLIVDDSKYYIKKSFSYPLSESEKDNVSVLASIDDNINAGKVGNVKISLNNKVLEKVPIYKNAKKKKENFFTKLFS